MGDKEQTRIYAYDLATRTEKLISDLEGADAGDLAVSPDRLWIAVSARSFRPSPADLAFKYRGGILWAISVDGQQARRLTPPYGVDTISGTSLSIAFSNPVWSADGSTLFFELSWFLINTSDYAYQSWLRLAEAGAVTDSGLPACRYQAPVARHPREDTLLVSRSCTGGGSSGLSEWAGPPFMEKRTLAPFETTEEYSFRRTSGAWLPDGSGGLLVAEDTHLKPGYSAVATGYRFRGGVYAWTVGNPAPTPVYLPKDMEPDVYGLIILPDGQVVVEVSPFGGDASDLHLFDRATGRIGEALTTGGKSYGPKW